MAKHLSLGPQYRTGSRDGIVLAPRALVVLDGVVVGQVLHGPEGGRGRFEHLQNPTRWN